MKKNFFSLAILAMMAFAGCSDSDNDNSRVTIDFEGAEWTALSATTIGEPYSSAVVANGYEWQDPLTTLSSRALVDYSYGAYIRCGVLLSSYNSDDITTYGDYSKDLYLYNPSSVSTTSGGGYAGSDNFLVVVGNYDDFASDDELAEMHFADGRARLIKGCYVNSTTYFLNVVQNGNPSIAAPLGEDDEIVISATGYDSTGAETATVRKTLARKGEYITEWSAWDLQALGRVVKVRFNIKGGPMTEWGMTTPKYFAIDNIVVEQ